MLGILGDAKINLAKFLFSDLQHESKDQKHVLSGVTRQTPKNLCTCASWQMWQLESGISGTRNGRQCRKWHAVSVYVSSLTPTARRITHWAPFLDHDIHTASCMKAHPGPGQAIQLLTQWKLRPIWHWPCLKRLTVRENVLCFKRLLYREWCTLQAARTVKWVRLCCLFQAGCYPVVEGLEPVANLLPNDEIR